LQGKLGTVFQDATLLQQALVHSSFLNENKDFTVPDNERLEFLGDAVLGLVIAEVLHQHFPQCTEGELTRLRSELVRQETLTKVARSLHLGDYLYLGKGEDLSGGRKRPRILSSALEAVIGALYLDQGLESTKEVIIRLLSHEMEKAVEAAHERDYKSLLQEAVQGMGMPAPAYRTVEATGPEHAKQFTVEVLIGGEGVLGMGTGKSKRQGEKAAARDALEKLEVMFQRLQEDILLDASSEAGEQGPFPLQPMP
jgi:ribonuclease-3